MVLLGGVGEALILKYIGAKLTTAIGTHLAHSSATAVTHFAMHSANATLMAANSAAATGGAAGAATALYHGAKANHKIVKAAAKERDAMVGVVKEGASEEEVAQAVFAFVLGALAQGYYETLDHTDRLGQSKTELTEIRYCRISDCGCHDLDSDSDGDCVDCGHSHYMHSPIDKDLLENGDTTQIRWLWERMAAELYPTLLNRNGNGILKDELREIDTCDFDDCPCFDFDLCEENQFFSRRCICGHRWREHTVTGSWPWIVMTLALQAIVSMMEEET